MANDKLVKIIRCDYSKIVVSCKSINFKKVYDFRNIIPVRAYNNNVRKIKTERIDKYEKFK